MHLNKYPNSEEIRLGRKGGYKNKLPKKPKASASVPVMENYIRKYNSWCDGIKNGAATAKKRETLQDQIRNHR